MSMWNDQYWNNVPGRISLCPWLFPSLPACDQLFECRDIILGLLPNTSLFLTHIGLIWMNTQAQQISQRSLCTREPRFSLQVMYQPMAQHCRNSPSILPLLLLAMEATNRVSGSPPQLSFPKGGLLHWDTAPISCCNLFHSELYHWNCLWSHTIKFVVNWSGFKSFCEMLVADVRLATVS